MAAFKTDELTDSFQLARNYGTLLLSMPTWSLKSVSNSFLGVLLDKLFKLFNFPRDIRAFKYGKELLVHAFVPRHYPDPSKKYQDFIRRKYERERLNSFDKSDVDNATRLYIIDLLHTSTFMTQELLKADDLVYLFNNFLKLAISYDILDMVVFEKARSIIMGLDSQLDEFYHLFNGFYDLAIQSPAKSSEVFGNSDDIVKNSIRRLNTYCDNLFSKSGAVNSFIFGSEHDQSNFAIDIDSNYALYKLILLLTHMSEFKSTGFKFLKFTDKKDAAINRYFLTKEPQLLVEALKVVTKRTFYNCADFSGLDMSGSDLEFVEQIIAKQKSQEKSLL